MEKKISIIIPVYNQRSLVEKCLNSFLNQNYKNYEIIVVNDGSTDGTREFLSTLKNKKIKIIHQENKGPSAARNAAFKKSSGEYILFIDADQEVSEGLLEECSEAFKAKDCLYIPERSKRHHDPKRKRKEMWTKIIDYERRILYEGTGRGVARGYKREVLERVGLFDESLKFGEDWDLAQRAKKAGYDLGELQTYLIHHELESPLHTIKKYFKYGRKARKLTRKRNDVAHFYSGINRRVIKNVKKYFVRNPFLFFGVFIYRITKTSSALIGYIIEALKEKI